VQFSSGGFDHNKYSNDGEERPSDNHLPEAPNDTDNEGYDPHTK
jgi:hypothetical protein